MQEALCPHCGHKWNTKSNLSAVSCTNCGRKVKLRDPVMLTKPIVSTSGNTQQVMLQKTAQQAEKIVRQKFSKEDKLIIDKAARQGIVNRIWKLSEESKRKEKKTSINLLLREAINKNSKVPHTWKEFYVWFYEKYYSIFKVRTNITFIAFSIAVMHLYDLPCVITIYGRGRSSKSTLATYLTEVINAVWFGYTNLDDVDKMLIDEFDFVNKNYMYNEDNKYMDIFRDPKTIPISWIDEAKLAFERRRAMTKKQIDRGNMLDLFADSNIITMVLCHNLSDIDRREIELTNIFFGLDRRGHAFVNCADKGLPFTKELAGFDALEKTSSNAKGLRNSKKAIKRMNSFICEVQFPDRSKSLLYKTAKKKKDAQRVGLSV